MPRPEAWPPADSPPTVKKPRAERRSERQQTTQARPFGEGEDDVVRVGSHRGRRVPLLRLPGCSVASGEPLTFTGKASVAMLGCLRRSHALAIARRRGDQSGLESALQGVQAHQNVCRAAICHCQWSDACDSNFRAVTGMRGPWAPPVTASRLGNLAPIGGLYICIHSQGRYIHSPLVCMYVCVCDCVTERDI